VNGIRGAGAAGGGGILHSRRRLLAGAAALLLVIGVVVVVVDPFAGGAFGGGGVVDNGASTGLVTVMRRSLSSQTPVSGTLGYSGSWTVAVPAGTSATDLQQAKQQETSAGASYAAARATATGDERTLGAARAALRAAKLKEASDCAGANAATRVANAGGGGGDASSPSSAGSTGSSPSAGSVAGASPCVSSKEAVTADQAAVASAHQKVAVDQAQLAGARGTLATARQALAAAQSAASSYDGSASYTMLPGAGEVIRRGRPLYAINGSPTLLVYGATPAWRSYAAGMSPGRDVAELNANLRALGYGATGGDAFTSATEQALRALQRAHGVPATGRLPLGSVAFEPAAVRVTSVTPTLGQAVQPGPIMTLSSTKHDVSIQLDASQQSQVKVGDRVLVTLPDNSTTPGVVSSVGEVATIPSSNQGNSGGGGSSTATVAVDVRLLHPAAGTLDQAPVSVSITTASISNALVVPVNALVALAGGGYAVEVVNLAGVHRLVAVTTGLFDDADGLVQVSGAGLRAGQRVVVPSS
jgi:peptidoglycan hydrolase-like protein with peptidoglycan-binding domain